MEFKTQTMEIGETLTPTERARFYRLVKSYREKPYPKTARELERYGLSIDEKDYGADQNVLPDSKDF